MKKDRRFINVAVIHQDGCTSSTQIWTDDPAEGRAKLDAFMQRGVKDKNPCVLGLIADEYLPIRRFTILDMQATEL